MTKKSIVKISLMVLGLLIAFNVETFAQKTDCSKTTDAELVTAIYNKIKVKYESQINHINVRAKNGVVTVEGWATTKKVKEKIENYAKKTKCVKNVMSNNFLIAIGGGCGPGTKPCGNICIPADEDCNITTKGS